MFYQRPLKVYAHRIELMEEQVKTVIEKLNQQNIDEEVLEYLGYVLEGLQSVRSIPIQSILNIFPRETRNLSKELNKKIELLFADGWMDLPHEMEKDVTSLLTHVVRWIGYSVIQQQGSFSIEANVVDFSLALSFQIKSEDIITFDLEKEVEINPTDLTAGRSLPLLEIFQQLSATHTYTQSEKELSLTITIPMTRVIN